MMIQSSVIARQVRKKFRTIKYVALRAKYLTLCLSQRNRRVEDILTCAQDVHPDACAAGRSLKKKPSLFITHSLGGGTYRYEKNYMRENSGKDIVVLRIFSYGKDLCYRLENKRNGQETYISPKKLTEVFGLEFDEVVICSLVTIYDLFSFIDLLLEHKKKNPGTKFAYHVHDFHCICPNHNLVAKDWYCNLECAEHRCRFDEFVYRYNGDIEQWRQKWSDLLHSTDEILCFSETSKAIVEEAYPFMDKRKVVVKPHDMSYCNFTPIDPASSVPSSIAIVGACQAVAKGRAVVEELLKGLSDAVTIHVVGSSSRHFSARRRNVVWHGSYELEELPGILEGAGVSLVVFPSVCPETFSYLVSELIMMGLPVVCFDIGAQADKVRAYGKGCLCENVGEMIRLINSRKQDEAQPGRPGAPGKG